MSSSNPFSDNLSKAASSMQEPDNSKEKKDEKDPMVEYGEQLVGMTTGMTASADTDTSPLSMLSKGMDFSQYSSDASKNNASPEQAKGMENSEELESVAKLAI